MKRSRLGKPDESSKARMCGQTNGTSAADCFEEVANALASFAAARAALVVAALKGFTAILRDAETAYRRALIDTPTRTQTFVDLQ